MLNNKNVCEFEAGVKQFSELQILTQHRCMMVALNKIFELVQRDIQLDVFNGWFYVKTSALWVLLNEWSGLIMSKLKLQDNKKLNQWERPQETYIQSFPHENHYEW